MADPKFPYVKWRDGRPRSSHGAYARAPGFVDGDLRHPPHDEDGRPVGRWFNLQEASDFSDKRKSEIEAARRAGKFPKKITVRKRSTIEDLLDDWSKSDEFKAPSAASQSSYRKCISAMLYRPQTREAAAAQDFQSIFIFKKNTCFSKLNFVLDVSLDTRPLHNSARVCRSKPVFAAMEIREVSVAAPVSATWRFHPTR